MSPMSPKIASLSEGFAIMTVWLNIMNNTELNDLRNYLFEKNFSFC